MFGSNRVYQASFRKKIKYTTNVHMHRPKVFFQLFRMLIIELFCLQAMVELNQKYAERGLAVVGFASNDFRQEAKDEEKAAEVCYVNYGVTFTMIAPSHVKGDDANPVFKALASQSDEPSWNFNKYLLDADGNVVQKFGSNTSPDSDKLVSAIEALLPQQ